MTLTFADVLAIVGIVAGLVLAVGGGSLAWIRADIRSLDQRLGADIAGMRADMTQLDERLRPIWFTWTDASELTWRGWTNASGPTLLPSICGWTR